MTFVFVSGRLALDFAGTLKWRTDEPEEQLAAPEDLQAWLQAAGLVSEPPRIGAAGLARAIALRESLYRAVTASQEGRAVRRADLDPLDAAAGRAPLRPRLDARGRLRREGGLDRYQRPPALTESATKNCALRITIKRSFVGEG